MTDINKTLQERAERYGEYYDVAMTSQAIKQIMEMSKGYGDLELDQCESLHMIANKIARIVNGDPMYSDSWHDIAGYATLIAHRLESEE